MAHIEWHSSLVGVLFFSLYAQLIVYTIIYLTVVFLLFSSTAESAKNEQNGQNVVVTDPYSGKLMNLERVSNAGSLRSTKSIGFIAYDK